MKIGQRLMAATAVAGLLAFGGTSFADGLEGGKETLAGWKSMSNTELKKFQGGTEISEAIIDSFDVTQVNDADLIGVNLGNKIKNNGIFATGSATANVTGNRGMTSVVQVTGAMNNVANNVMYNIYLK